MATEGNRFQVTSITGAFVSGVSEFVEGRPSETFMGRLWAVDQGDGTMKLEVERNDQGTISREEAGQAEGSDDPGQEGDEDGGSGGEEENATA